MEETEETAEVCTNTFNFYSFEARLDTIFAVQFVLQNKNVPLTS